VVALRQLWLQGQPDVPEHLVMDARRALFGERAFAWREAASKTVNFDHPNGAHF